MKKGKLFFVLVGFIVLLTIILIVVGVLFNKETNEKLTGFTGEFDISAKGMIAYVQYSDGKPEIYLYDYKNDKTMKLLELENDKLILEPTFSNDGSVLTYISTTKNLEESLISNIYQVNLINNENSLLFTTHKAITEIELSPDEKSLFYLQAGVFQNYSPIASERPHEYDIYEYRLSEDTHIQHTNLKKYSMSSLRIVKDGKSVFVQMEDDANVKTAEDSFNVKLRIFEILLEQPSEPKVVSDPKREVDIYNFDLISTRDEIVFQSIANNNDDELFQYELYSYNLKTKEEKQLTKLKEYTTNPIVREKENKVYFLVDYQFGQGTSDYRIFEMSLDGTEMKEIPLPNIEK